MRLKVLHHPVVGSDKDALHSPSRSSRTAGTPMSRMPCSRRVSSRKTCGGIRVFHSMVAILPLSSNQAPCQSGVLTPVEGFAFFWSAALFRRFYTFGFQEKTSETKRR